MFKQRYVLPHSDRLSDVGQHEKETQSVEQTHVTHVSCMKEVSDWLMELPVLVLHIDSF